MPEYRGEVIELSDTIDEIRIMVENLNDDAMRTQAIARKKPDRQNADLFSGR